MTALVEFFRQITEPRLEHVQDAQELRAAVIRMQALLREAQQASEQIKQNRYGAFR